MAKAVESKKIKEAIESGRPMWWLHDTDGRYLLLWDRRGQAQGVKIWSTYCEEEMARLNQALLDVGANIRQ